MIAIVGGSSHSAAIRPLSNQWAVPSPPTEANRRYPRSLPWPTRAATCSWVSETTTSASTPAWSRAAPSRLLTSMPLPAAGFRTTHQLTASPKDPSGQNGQSAAPRRSEPVATRVPDEGRPPHDPGTKGCADRSTHRAGGADHGAAVTRGRRRCRRPSGRSGHHVPERPDGPRHQRRVRVRGELGQDRHRGDGTPSRLHRLALRRRRRRRLRAASRHQRRRSDQHLVRLHVR